MLEHFCSRQGGVKMLEHFFTPRWREKIGTFVHAKWRENSGTFVHAQVA